MSEEIWIELLISLTTIASFAGVCIGAMLYKKLNYVGRYLFLYLIAAFITDLTSRYLHTVFNNTLILVPLFGFIELLIFSIIYRHMVFKNNYLFKPIITIFLILILVDIFTSNAFTPKEFQSYGRILDSIVIIFFSLFFYWKMLNNESNQNRNLLRLNTAIFLFFLFNCLWFVVTNFIVNIPYKTTLFLWYAILILTPLFYSFLTFYLWKNGRMLK